MEITLLVTGTFIALVSALADFIGYGDGLAFGVYQIIGTLLGIGIALAGAWMKWGEQMHFPIHPSHPRPKAT